MPYVYDIIV